jgi:uncharacterized lipoprotein YajG
VSRSATRANPLPIGLVLLLIAAACTSGVDIRYREAGAHASLLASAGPMRVSIAPVVDRRVDTERVGTDEKDGDIVTARPVVDIVHEALSVELGKNGYAISVAERDATVAITVQEFWIDIAHGYSKPQCVSRVSIALVVTDGQTGGVLFTRRYIGTRRQEVDKVSNDAVRAIMGAALARTMRSIATDPALVAVFGRSRASAARGLSPVLRLNPGRHRDHRAA